METNNPLSTTLMKNEVDQMDRLDRPLERGLLGRFGRKEEHLKPYDDPNFNILLETYSPRVRARVRDETPGVLIQESNIEAVSTSVKQVVKAEELVVEQLRSGDGEIVNKPHDQIMILLALGRALQESRRGSSIVKFQTTTGIPVGSSVHTVSAELSVKGDDKYGEVLLEPKEVDRFLVTAVQYRKGRKVTQSVTHLVEAPTGKDVEAFDDLRFELENTGNYTFQKLDRLGPVTFSFRAVDSGLRTRGGRHTELEWNARGDWALVGSDKDADPTIHSRMERNFKNEIKGASSWIVTEVGRVLEHCGAKGLAKKLSE